MSRSYYCEDKEKMSYDYEKQAWIMDGKYLSCNHPKEMNCDCYGRLHAGEKAIITEMCR